MPGNRSIYNDAIKKGHNAAWDGKWKKAVEEYRRALAEFPDDLVVRNSLAQALEGLGQWESAMREYESIVKAQPNDPVPLMRVAALQAKMKRSSEAAGTYLAAAELFLKTKQVPRAIEAWRQAAELEPDRTDLHQKLAEVYARSGQMALASMEHLALAQIYRKRGDDAKATSLAQQALTLDPKNAAARGLIEEMKREHTAQPSAGHSPVDEAEKAALSRLAQTVLEESAPPPGLEEERRDKETRPRISQMEVDSLIARAVDAQMNHRVNEAIEAYRKLMTSGITRPEIKFNLGLLYFESMRYDEAIHLLQETVADKDYALASHYALGQCYRAQGKLDNAVEHFLYVVRIVDLSSVRREQADDLISVYEGLAESYAAKGDRAKAESFTQALEEFLTNRGWEDKVSEVRHHLESLRAADSQISLAEVIEVPGSDKVLEALALSNEYLRREKLGAASEECYRAIELAPNYLPAHIRLAEILIKQDRIAEARTKYQTLADLCLIRGDFKRTESLYRSELKIAPDDVATRAKLIDLLAQQNRTDDALEQYLELGELYVRQGQTTRAMEKFNEGARIATRTGNNSPFAIALRHRVAEERVRQGDLKGALATYQEIRQQSPGDERARFYIVDLGLRLGNRNAALNELDELVAFYQSRQEPQKAIGVVEALASSYPSESALTMRLAQCYHVAGKTDKAVEILDVLADTLFNAGQKETALTVVQQIIAMNPPRVEDYRALLAKLSE